MSITVVALLALTAPAPAIAVTDLGGEVGVLLTDIDAADGRLAVERDRIEIAIGTGITPTTLDVADRVIKKVEILADPPRLSIQTRYGPRTTSRLARGGVLETIDGKARIRLSRSVDHADVARSAPPNGPMVAERVLETPWVPSATPVPSPVLRAAAIEISATPEPEVVPAAPPAPALLTGTPAKITGPRTVAHADDGLSRALTWGTVLALIAAAVVLIRTAQKRRQTPDRGELTVLSSRALSPKVRVVLVGIGGRQLLLSVADKGAELLTEIMPDELASDATLSPAERALARVTSGFARAQLQVTAATAPTAPSTPPRESSSAVSGLLALRARATGTDEIPRGAAWTQRAISR